MPGSHRNDDSRACGASTVVTNQTNVFVNGRLWAVSGDPDSHGDGGLSPGGSNKVYINSLQTIVLGDGAAPDDLCPIVGGAHCAPSAASASSDVFSGG